MTTAKRAGQKARVKTLRAERWETRLEAAAREARARLQQRAQGRVRLGPDGRGYWYAPAGTSGAALTELRLLWVAWCETTGREREAVGAELVRRGASYLPRSRYFETRTKTQ